MRRYKQQTRYSRPVGPGHDNPLASPRDFDHLRYRVRLIRSSYKNFG